MIMQNRGFTVLEILIAVAILVVLGALILSPFSKFRTSQILNSETENILSLITQARENTLSSADASQYGVHFENMRAVMFKGATYSASDSNNKPISISSQAQISTISLSGGGTDVVFQRLTGKTNQSGTVTLSLKSNPTKTRVIKIESTGLAGL